MKLIVCSRNNTASANMYDVFLKLGFEKTGDSFDEYPVHERGDFLLINVHNEIMDLTHLSEHFAPEVYLIASSHTSASGDKTLSVHAPGNWTDNQLGGNAGELPPAPALLMRNVFFELQKNCIEGYSVCFEVTHHAPSMMNAPICYIECGGSAEEWNDLSAIEAVCKSILSCGDVAGDDVPTAVGFGGTHYTPNFEKSYVLDQYAFAHICSKHRVDDVDEKTVLDAFEKTIPRATVALIDWKGLSGPQKKKITGILDGAKIPWKKLRELKPTSA